MIKSDHKNETLLRSPNTKLAVERDGLGPTNNYTLPKIRKSNLEVMDFCKTFDRFVNFSSS